ncbi:hypothetical protein CJF30_00010472 [Rutstroemia sp. NJR-2017a BBW]|nr:hypothetical protein CJF30_00010472 [Rutstroemia sp. NJR-2017a BBW]
MQPTFESHKGEIRQLFLSDRLTISTIQEIMRKKYNFNASLSAYKTQLAEWNLFVPIPTAKIIKHQHQHLSGTRKRPEKLYKVCRDPPRSVPLTPPLTPPVLLQGKQQSRAGPNYLSVVVHSEDKKGNVNVSFYQDEYVLILSNLRGRLREALGKESG